MEYQKKLRDEIIEKRKNVVTDTLNFSVGEIINLYRDKEIDLEPAFQRFFRWSTLQQSKFIESLLLGYPIPPIFVFQKEDGIWEVIDGVQRISTILNFVGMLEESEPLLLESGDILKELNNKCWDEETKKRIFKIAPSSISAIDKATIIDFKRAKLSVIVLSNKSIETSKLELFKRLNSAGTKLNDQEIRNALIYMTSVEMFELIDKFSENILFREIIRLDENLEKLSFDKEVITRYLIIANEYREPIKPLLGENAESFYDRSIESILKNNLIETISEDIGYFQTILTRIYNGLDTEYGFRIYNEKKKIFSGAFSWFVFEIICHFAFLNKDKNIPDEILFKIIKELKTPSIQGTRTLDRMLKVSKTKAEELKNEYNLK